MGSTAPFGLFIPCTHMRVYTCTCVYIQTRVCITPALWWWGHSGAGRVYHPITVIFAKWSKHRWGYPPPGGVPPLCFKLDALSVPEALETTIRSLSARSLILAHRLLRTGRNPKAVYPGSRTRIRDPGSRIRNPGSRTKHRAGTPPKGGTPLFFP